MQNFTHKGHSKAFTLLELIMVIVILGIVSSLGSEIIANVYKNYILQRATHRASQKTELAAQQIANFLSYSIPGTTLARNPATLSDSILISEVDPTLGGDEDNIHTIIEWIGSDYDSFSSIKKGAWNGFCDVAGSDQDNIKTPGSKLNKAKIFIDKLSGGDVNLNDASSELPAIFFRDRYYTNDSTQVYNPKKCMGILNFLIRVEKR